MIGCRLSKGHSNHRSQFLSELFYFSSSTSPTLRNLFSLGNTTVFSVIDAT